MADGDILRNGLGCYKKLYQWLCEGKASMLECTQVAIKALKSDLKKKGDLPIKLAESMGERLFQLFNVVDDKSCIDWNSANMEIEKTLQVDGIHDVKELILHAGKIFLHDIRYGGNPKISADSISEAIICNYMNIVFESGFQGRIPLVDKHHAGMEDVALKQLIRGIQPEIVSVISNWAKNATSNGSILGLRLPRQSRAQIDMDEDLC
jgi:hypothetical protein